MSNILPVFAPGTTGDVLPVKLAVQTLQDVDLNPLVFVPEEIYKHNQAIESNLPDSIGVSLANTGVSASEVIESMRDLPLVEGARYFADRLQRPMIEGILKLREEHNGELPKTIILNQGGMQIIGGIYALLRPDVEIVLIDPVSAPFAGMPYLPAQSIFPEFIPVSLQHKLMMFIFAQLYKPLAKKIGDELGIDTGGLKTYSQLQERVVGSITLVSPAFFKNYQKTATWEAVGYPPDPEASIGELPAELESFMQNAHNNGKVLLFWTQGSFLNKKDPTMQKILEMISNDPAKLTGNNFSIITPMGDQSKRNDLMSEGVYILDQFVPYELLYKRIQELGGYLIAPATVGNLTMAGKAGLGMVNVLNPGGPPDQSNNAKNLKRMGYPITTLTIKEIAGAADPSALLEATVANLREAYKQSTFVDFFRNNLIADGEHFREIFLAAYQRLTSTEN